MRHKLAAAMFAAALLAGAILAGLSVLDPAAAQTLPKVLEACKAAQKTIDASKLPDVWDPAKCPVEDMVIRDGAAASVLPAPGRSVYVEAMTISGAQELTITRAKDGTVELGKVGNESQALEPESSEFTVLAANNECSDSAYTKAGHRVQGTLRYSFNRGTTPRGVGGSIAAERAIRGATGNITQTRNRCRLGDRVSAKADYMGNTSKLAQIDNSGWCARDDGKSIVSFGKMPYSYALAVTCVWSLPQRGYDKVTSSDLKINTYRKLWTTDPGSSSCRNRFDIASVATHEFGHTFGLNHVSERNHPNLTMSTQSNGTCQATERTLGRGDVIGLGRIY